MDIPVKAQVECLDGPCGQSTCIIIDPVKRFVTHVVVEDKDEPEAQYLVPLNEFKLSMPHLIQLRCTKYELRKMPRFIHITQEDRMMPYTFYPPGSNLGPTMIWERDLVPVPHEASCRKADWPSTRAHELKRPMARSGNSTSFCSIPALSKSIISYCANTICGATRN